MSRGTSRNPTVFVDCACVSSVFLEEWETEREWNLEGLRALIVMGIRLLALSVMDGVGNSMGLTLWFAGHKITSPSYSTSRSLVCFIADQHDPRLAQEVYVPLLLLSPIFIHPHLVLFIPDTHISPSTLPPNDA